MADLLSFLPMRLSSFGGLWQGQF